jgi:hypothetical protein
MMATNLGRIAIYSKDGQVWAGASVVFQPYDTTTNDVEAKVWVSQADCAKGGGTAMALIQSVAGQPVSPDPISEPWNETSALEPMLCRMAAEAGVWKTGV